MWYDIGMDKVLHKRRLALARHLGLDEKHPEFQDILDLIECDGDNIFVYYNQEYLVLTNEEADEDASVYIKDNIWAFSTEFILSHTRGGFSDRKAEAIKSMQEKLCEDANEILYDLISDISVFIKDAISEDGRGHFLSPYDREEHEEGEYFIYRLDCHGQRWR